MTKGIRFFDGKEYLLAGRYFEREAARMARISLRKEWGYVRIVKLHDFDYLLYVHGYLTP